MKTTARRRQRCVPLGDTASARRRTRPLRQRTLASHRRMLLRCCAGRLRRLAKGVRVLDADTRRAVRDARLEALEADNYVEDTGLEDDADAADDLYVHSDEEGPGSPRGTRKATKRKGAKRGAKGAKRQRSAAAASGAVAGAWDAARGKERVRTLAQHVLDAVRVRATLAARGLCAR